MATTRILLVQQNWLGDVLFATPAIRAVRKKYPTAHIACLVAPRAEVALKYNPSINEIIVCEDRLSFFSPKFWRMVSLLRAKQFDTAIFFHRSKTKMWLTRLADVRERWGYAAPGRSPLLSRAIEPSKERLHRIDYFLYLVDRLGILPGGRIPEFFPKPSAADEFAKLMQEAGVLPSQPYVVVHAGGNWNLKRWPAEYFSQWIYFFREKYLWKVILCGTSSEQGVVDKILSKFSTDGGVISLCGKTSFDSLALLLAGSRFLLSNDSGPIHLAASQKTKIIGLFGPTSPLETGPVSEAPVMILQKDVGCRVPCYFHTCNYRVCMDFLLPKDVFLATCQFLEPT